LKTSLKRGSECSRGRRPRPGRSAALGARGLSYDSCVL